MDKMIEDELRRFVNNALESEKRQLLVEVDLININGQIDTIIKERIELWDLPKDILKTIQELKKIRQTRHCQFLRAILHDLSHEID